MAAERGSNGRFKPRAVVDQAPDAPPETVVPRETTVSPPAFSGQLRLVVDDVTPSIDRTGAPPPPLALPPEAGELGPDVDDVPLYEAATRGLDWGIGAALGEQYRATPEHLDTVAEAAAPIARRLADLVGAAEAVDATVPPLIRELAVLAAAVYVAWGDAAELAVRAAIDAYRHRGEEDDASAEDRSARGADGGARDRGRRAGRVAGPAGGVGGAAEAPEVDRPIGPPGPSEDRGADLAAGFEFGRRLRSSPG